MNYTEDDALIDLLIMTNFTGSADFIIGLAIPYVVGILTRRGGQRTDKCNRLFFKNFILPHVQLVLFGLIN